MIMNARLRVNIININHEVAAGLITYMSGYINKGSWIN